MTSGPGVRWVKRAGIAVASLGLLLGACGRQEVGQPEGPPLAPGDPLPVPINVPLSQVVAACERMEDFVTTPGEFGDYRELAPGVRVRFFARKASIKNNLATLASGNIIGRFENDGDAAFPQLALQPKSAACWQVGTAEGMLVSRMVGLDQTVAEVSMHLTVHDTAHLRDYGAWRSIGLALGQPDPLDPGNLFRLAALRSPAVQDSTGQGDEHSWVTCISNGCCSLAEF